jgi:hypothetical protein
VDGRGRSQVAAKLRDTFAASSTLAWSRNEKTTSDESSGRESKESETVEVVCNVFFTVAVARGIRPEALSVVVMALFMDV